METKTNQTTEKVLADALELREKGVSLPSIVSTYPAYREDIEELFANISFVETKKESVLPSERGLRALLAKLPETDSTPQSTSSSTASPYVSFWSTAHLSSLKFILPVAAIALFIAGGFIVEKKPATPIVPDATMPGTDTRIAMTTPPQENGGDAQSAAKTTAPMAMMMTAAEQSAAERSINAFSNASSAESESEKQYVRESELEGQLAMADGTHMGRNFNDPTKNYGF